MAAPPQHQEAPVTPSEKKHAKACSCAIVLPLSLCVAAFSLCVVCIRPRSRPKKAFMKIVKRKKKTKKRK